MQFRQGRQHLATSAAIASFSCNPKPPALAGGPFTVLHIYPVPQIAYGHFTLPQLQKLLSKSKISTQPAEGLYLRLEQREWLKQRAKLVRPAFIQSIEQHWSHSHVPMKPNKLNFEYSGLNWSR